MSTNKIENMPRIFRVIWFMHSSNSNIQQGLIDIRYNLDLSVIANKRVNLNNFDINSFIHSNLFKLINVNSLIQDELFLEYFV